VSLARPLDRFSLVRTSDLDEVLAARSRMYATPKFEVVGRRKTFWAVVNLCELRHTRISYGAYAAGLRMRFPETSFATQVFLLAGKTEAVIGRRSETIAPGRALVISPHEGFGVSHDCDYERLVLSARSESLVNVLAAITGRNCPESPKFHPVQDYTVSAARTLRDHFLFLVRQLTVSPAPLPKPVLDEYEQTLMVMFLHANHNNYSHVLERTPRDAALWQVRRAEEFIEANWQRAITLQDLAAVTGVSALSLFRTFKAYRGYSPFAFLAVVRARHGRTLQ